MSASHSDAHESTRQNIIEKLFPKKEYQDDIYHLFSDNILNETKETIKGLKYYIIEDKKDTSFKNKINEATNNIKTIFKK